MNGLVREGRDPGIWRIRKTLPIYGNDSDGRWGHVEWRFYFR